MLYKHYKGGIYEFVGEAQLEADLTPMIVYRAKDGSLWVRPKAIFFELVGDNGRKVPRFQLVEQET